VHTSRIHPANVPARIEPAQANLNGLDPGLGFGVEVEGNE
jgi:hypothetical protein